ncbi:hypothetical protein PCASD_20688 [Puccinia coronata f. sp. avenae]|nr:hypothetical protein PCASD_20688 [Puccinia coronata f. sp. avenae]
MLELNTFLVGLVWLSLLISPSFGELPRVTGPVLPAQSTWKVIPKTQVARNEAVKLMKYNNIIIEPRVQTQPGSFRHRNGPLDASFTWLATGRSAEIHNNSHYPISYALYDFKTDRIHLRQDLQPNHIETVNLDEDIGEEEIIWFCGF